MLNILATFCGLVICLLLFYFDRLKTNIENSQYNLFKLGHYIVVVNLLVSLGRLLCNNYFVSDYILQYILTIFFHITNTFLLYLFTAYCVSLVPGSILFLKKYFVYSAIPYGIIIFLILTSNFTKLVYYIDGTTIKNGPLYIISFITALLSFCIVLFNTFFLHSKELATSRKHDICLILVIPALLLSLEFAFPNLVLSGFSYACNLLIIYNSFFIDKRDNFSGFSSHELYYSLLKNVLRKNKKFTIFYIKIHNLDFIKSICPIKESRLFFAKLNKNFVDYKQTIETFYIGNGTYALISKVNEETKVLKIANNIKYDLDHQLFIHNLNNVKLEYSFCVATREKAFDKIEDIPYIENYVNNNKFEQNNFVILNEQHKKEIDETKILVKNISDLVDVFDVNYHSNKINQFDTNIVEVYYQPILNNKINQFLSAEALMRLNIKELGGIVYPNRFIPYLEEKNLIHRFSCIMLTKVCKFIKELEKQGKDIEGISVNFSLIEFLDDNFETDIIRIVKNFDVNPNKIHIEITETTQIEDVEQIRQKMIFLKEKGFKFYLDDFGTGYSNLSKLVDLPFDVIKFDKSLIDKSLVDNTTEDMINHLSTFMLNRNLKILFEGIEDVDGEMLMKKYNATFAQGYKYSRPIPTEKSLQFFQEN